MWFKNKGSGKKAINAAERFALSESCGGGYVTTLYKPRCNLALENLFIYLTSFLLTQVKY